MAQARLDLGLHELQHLAGELQDRPLQGFDFRAAVLGLRNLIDLQAQKRMSLRHGGRLHAPRPLNDDLNDVIGAGYLFDDPERSDRIQISQRRFLDRWLPLREHPDKLVFPHQRRLHCRNRDRPAYRERHHQVGEEHAVFDRQDGDQCVHSNNPFARRLNKWG